MIPEALLGVFVIFCRVGGCLLIAPGLSSQRVTSRARLFIAVTVTLAVAPLLLPQFGTGLRDAGPADILGWIGCETLTGLAIGFFGRSFYFALETMATGVATMIGLGGNRYDRGRHGGRGRGVPGQEQQPAPGIRRPGA